MDINLILISILIAFIGGFIGTFFGAFFVSWKKESKMKGVRKIAKKGLDIIKEYAKDGKTYCIAQNDFNNKINITEKRIILVCLHKLGVPVENSIGNNFDIRNIRFSSKKIDKTEIESMELQINNGYCDHLFYADVDTYFTENAKIKTIRNIAKKYIETVFAKTKRNKDKLNYPQDWINNFTHGEHRAINAFIGGLINDRYFDNSTGEPIKEHIDKLIVEVENGLWDTTLEWDYDAYCNIRAQERLALDLSGSFLQQQENKKLEAT
ncbi:MAG: hypothetical protein FWE37_08340 [Spirochaetaceae bacterium]|nr:hypothetical protein [Spirochaetaceae bacterium]